jgi:ubiquinone/menaquinone biosynthesis C-methylase UbiE
MLSKELKQLYDGYYSQGVKKKRLISAKDSVREIKNITKGLEISNLLDVGSGDGTVIEEMEQSKVSNSISIAEISDSSIDVIKSRNIKSILEIKQFDGYNIPYEDKSFDISTATYVLEHVEHERLFLREMARVSDYVLISVPLENTIGIEKALKAGVKIGHINFYTIETFKSILETSGLEVVSIYAYTTSLEYEMLCSKKYGRYKYLIRKTILKLAPKIARRYFTYMGIALCKANTDK